MKAWVCENPVGVEALQWRELPPPALGPGQIRVQIKAASLNFPDLLIVQNKYQMKPPLPFVPGTEFSGVVSEVGEGVKGFAVGQRVAAFGGLGGFATEVCIPAVLAMPLPDAFSFEDAAAFICTYATSHHALIDRAALQAGETVRFPPVMEFDAAKKRLKAGVLLDPALEVARGKPAELAGLGELQKFLERGYSAFKGMRDPAKFVNTIVEREWDILKRLYAGEKVMLA